jgi:hypothetical protein
MKMQQIRLLHTADCHAYHQALDELEAALVETGWPVQFEVILIASDREAKRYKFLGSPAIHIDGRDVDPMAAEATQYSAQGCRPYFWQGKPSDFPPKEMILQTLKRR